MNGKEMHRFDYRHSLIWSHSLDRQNDADQKNLTLARLNERSQKSIARKEAVEAARQAESDKFNSLVTENDAKKKREQDYWNLRTDANTDVTVRRHSEDERGMREISPRTAAFNERRDGVTTVPITVHIPQRNSDQKARRQNFKTFSPIPAF